MTNVLTYERDWGNLGHRKPILLQHGHHMDSAIWFKEHNTGKPLPLQLFDAGYDVWLGNNRGSLNSGFSNQRHSSMNLEDFFDFTIAEMGEYDLPAFIYKIKQETQADKIAFIGYE